MSAVTNCPNCDAKLEGVFNFNFIVSKEITEALNVILEKNAEAYCDKCSKTLSPEAKYIVSNCSNGHLKAVKEAISLIPAVSINMPPKWDYDAIGIITAQMVTGTGMIAEIASSFSDLFGLSSNALSSKLKNAENVCFMQLKKQAFDLGGNAVVGIDIDYAEVGGEKGMLMVCMTGTAVRLNNIKEIVGAFVEKVSEIQEAKNKSIKLEELGKLLPS